MMQYNIYAYSRLMVVANTKQRTHADTKPKHKFFCLDMKQQKPLYSYEYRGFFGAGDRTRTGTLSPAVDFESTTSTNSITPANTGCNALYYTALYPKFQEISSKKFIFYAKNKNHKNNQRQNIADIKPDAIPHLHTAAFIGLFLEILPSPTIPCCAEQQINQ